MVTVPKGEVDLNIKEIAKIAAVSVSTVSRVLNDSTEVKEETREKIIEIMRENNYIPNNSARNLKRINSKTVGLLVDSGYNPFFYEIINIINKELSEKGYSMVTQYMDSRKNDMQVAKEFIKEKRLTALISIGLNIINVDESLFSGIDIPLVSLSSEVAESLKEKLSSVTIDDFKSAYEATEYLINNGHKEIGIITSLSEDEYCGKTRLSGYEKALKDNNIRVKKSYIQSAEYSFQTGYNAMKKLLLKKKIPTAVFVISDIMAIGAIRAAIELDFKVPEDISVIGFDGIDYGKYYTPQLTTVKQPYEYMAIESVNLIMELINDKSKNRHIKFDVKILERESVKKITD